MSQGRNYDGRSSAFRNARTYYVHYTVRTDATREPKKCVSGPYSAAEAVDARRDLAKGGGVTAAYVSEDSKCG